MNTPLHEELAAWFVDLLERKVAPRIPDYIEKSAGNLFINGMNATHAYTVGGVTNAIKAIDGKFEIDAVPLPVGSMGRQGTCYSGNMHMISSQSKHPDAAWELLKMFTSGEAGVLMVLEAKLQPNGHKSAWTNPEVNKVNRMFGITDSLLSKGIEPFPMPKNVRFSEANKAFEAEVDQIWEGQVSWKDHVSVVEAKVQAVLDLPRP